MQRKIILEGKYVRLEEISPKYFEKVIEWRNNPELNKFLNQPFKLTMELEKQWYEKKYLNDMTQGLLIMIDKKNNLPFGTIGWTDYDFAEKICIAGRALVGEDSYRGSKEMTEAYLIFQDYMYKKMQVKTAYIHVVDENTKVISLNKRWGYILNKGEIRFPKELLVNGMKQTEYLRTSGQYEKAREKIIKILESL